MSVNTLVGYSTQPDNVAIDGSGRNSPYTAALLKHMDAGIEIGQVMMQVRSDVFEATHQQQVPWEHSSLTRPFYFSRNADTAAVQPPMAKPPETPRPVVPPVPATVSAQPPIPSQPDMKTRILNWVQHEYVGDRVTYAATVDWYDKGIISREAVLQDREKYQASWPERRFTLVPGTLQLSDAGPSRHTATFSMNYWVRNARGEERSGRSYLVIELVSSGSQLVLTRQKEVVQRQR